MSEPDDPELLVKCPAVAKKLFVIGSSEYTCSRLDGFSKRTGAGSQSGPPVATLPQSCRLLVNLAITFQTYLVHRISWEVAVCLMRPWTCKFAKLGLNLKASCTKYWSGIIGYCNNN
jgi:hypothetical protein